MINSSRWVQTLKIKNDNTINDKKYELDPYIWTNTLPHINPVNTLPNIDSNRSIKKYFFTTIILIVGFALVAFVKNETRNLQKELNILATSIDELKFDLYQSTLDHNVITSPENISKLAREYLGLDLITYKKSQIEQLDQIKDKKEIKAKNNDFKKDIKLHIAKKIEDKKIEMRKIQQLYSKPKELPEYFKTKVIKKVTKTKIDLKKIYLNPKDSIDVVKAQKWAALQLVKVVLGLPIVPGK